MFEYLHRRYIYDPAIDSFIVQRMEVSEILNSNSTLSNTGLDSSTHRQRLIQYGSNLIDIKGSKWYKILLLEVFRLINLFQVITCAVCFWKQYAGYATIIILLTIFSIFVSFWQKRKSHKMLKRLVQSYSREVRVIRDGESFMAGSTGLVPGDLVEITGRVTLPCDMVLLSGSLEVDESTITGDTVPAQKVAYQLKGRVSLAKTSIKQENQLIGGSKILASKPAQNETSVLAVVTRTGFNSVKGKIVRSVLLAQGQATKHPYIRDIENFATWMIPSAIALIIMAIVYYFIFPHFVDLNMGPANLFDIGLIAVPAFLPLIYIWPILLAERRLKYAAIQVSDMTNLMKFGVLDCCCYDKTGTLTQDTVGLHGIIEVKNGPFSIKYILKVLLLILLVLVTLCKLLPKHQRMS
jgi:cation-transporting ATPase 13A3/4/5